MAAEIITLFALMLYNESRGEPLAGQMAVASTLWNRGGGEVMKMVDAVRKPGAYCLDGVEIPASGPDANAWETCLMIAKSMAEGRFEPTTVATHFYAWTSGCIPFWSASMREVERVGGHVFYV